MRFLLQFPVNKLTIGARHLSKSSSIRFASTARQMSTATPFKFAGIQLHVDVDKQQNLQHAMTKVEEAANNGAQVVMLPVCDVGTEERE
jgi:hypothetical protein